MPLNLGVANLVSPFLAGRSLGSAIPDNFHGIGNRPSIATTWQYSCHVIRGELRRRTSSAYPHRLRPRMWLLHQLDDSTSEWLRTYSLSGKRLIHRSHYMRSSDCGASRMKFLEDFGLAVLEHCLALSGTVRRTCHFESRRGEPSPDVPQRVIHRIPHFPNFVGRIAQADLNSV